MLIESIAVVVIILVPLVGMLWKMFSISAANDEKLNDKIDGLTYVMHEGFGENRVQHAEMAGRFDLVESRMTLQEKKTHGTR